MSWQSGRRLLVLGGIRSGKSEFAEQIVSASTQVRYVATAAGAGDPTWAARIAAHRDRRPQQWSTEETGADPGRLVTLLADAKPDEVLLVDDLGGWLTATLDAAGAWDAGAGAPDDPAVTSFTPDGAATPAAGAAAALTAAVRDCPAAMLVLVSPEVGLTVVPPTPSGRLFADAIGTLNQAVAQECDAVAFVVAGQPTWVKGTDPRGPAAGARLTPVTGGVSTPAVADATAQVATPAPEVTAPARTPTGVAAITVGMSLPMPDENAPAAAGERLATLGVAGFGALAPVVRFAAGTQGQAVPQPWQQVRMLVLHTDHDGDVAAGDSPAASARRLDAAERGEGPWALLAGTAGVAVQTVRWPRTAAAIEHTDALEPDEVDAALEYGWQLAESAVDTGTDLIVLGSGGAGADAVAAAIISLTANGEIAALLGRVIGPDGRIDDLAWMRRCAAVRDALHRVRARARDPRALLATLGGADHAVATGVLLGAVARRTPVMIDGPVGVAAALVARDFGAQTRHWLVLPDTGGHPAVQLGAEVLGVTPVLDLRLGLGEGATALAALPLLRSALTLAATLPASPPPASATAPSAPPGV
ncbi:bifunctional adenosylcobinamide kinase/adenosylcobinamide-phosphate guanylyltransferase [Planosporangium sp. 12N6]|uniref:bifunctional adenosylcobinamide kinase/adenosylcobinamide-phosphate guanylyltransferase n=1 Tax=Planosporangium spinosum TaxID=3402278 RepID=UPI003CFB3E94